MLSILIGADICPIEANQPHCIAGDADALFHDLLPELQQADLVITNLECPLIEQPTPISKTGPTFGEPGACINGIRAAGIDVLCLANNHILDHGPAGLRNTLAVCANAGIATVGAGENLAAARRILIRQVGPIRLGVLAMAEHEFSIATKDSWGANPIDLIDFVRNVNANRDEFDYLVVLVHGGAEFFVPSPRLKDACRFLVEMGANAVIVQHPHVLGGYEQYEGGHIIYGQGALIMDEAIYRDRESFHEGFLVKLTIEDENPSSHSALRTRHSPVRSAMEIIPFLQSAPPPGARRMAPDREAQFRQALEERSRAIQDAAFVEAEWLRFCRELKHGYISGLLGHNRLLRKSNANGLLTKTLYGRRQLLGVRNLVCCETHREALETIFNQQMI